MHRAAAYLELAVSGLNYSGRSGILDVDAYHVRRPLMAWIRLRSDCPDGRTCPAVWRTDRGTLAVVGSRITDPDVVATLGLPAHESIVEIPLSLLPEVVGDVERG